MELDAVEAAVRRLERSDRRLGRRRERGEPGWCLVDGVAVRHPARLLMRQVAQQAPLLVHGQLRAAELADLGALDLAAEVEHHRLHAVTDAEHRDAELEQLVAQLRRAVGIDRRRAAGQDQATGPAPFSVQWPVPGYSGYWWVETYRTSARS